MSIVTVESDCTVTIKTVKIKIDDVTLFKAINEVVPDDLSGFKLIRATIEVPRGGDYSGMQLDFFEMDVSVELQKVTQS